MKSTSSIRSLLFVLALAVSAPLIVVLAFSLYVNVSHETERAKQNALTLADLAIDDIEHMFDHVQRPLILLGAKPIIRSALGGSDECRAALLELQPNYPGVEFLLILDSQGKPLCSIPERDFSTFPFADEVWFRQALASERLIVPPIQSQLIANQAISVLAHSLDSPNDGRRGVFVVGIALSQFRSTLEHARRADGGFVALLDGSGTVVASVPDQFPLANAGTPVSELQDMLLNRQEGTVQVRAENGMERVLGFATIPLTDWRVVTGEPSGWAAAAVWQSVLGNGLLLVGSILLVATLATLFSNRIEHPIRALLQATTSVTGGNLSTRVAGEGPAELAQLAARFNAMLDAREQADSELRETEEKYRTLVENMPAIVYRTTLDQPLQTVYVNSRLTDLLGYSASEWAANHELRLQYIFPLDRAIVLAALAHTRATNQPLTVEYRMTARDGHLVWMREEAAVLPASASHPRLLQGVLLDVTKHKAADERLAYQANLLEQVHDAIIATDIEQRITAWNHAASVMYGWTAAEAIGHLTREILPTEIDSHAEAEFLRTLDEQGAGRIEVKQYRNTGEPLFVEVSTMALRERDGHTTGYVSVNRDMTQQTRAAEELQRRTAHAEALVHTAGELNARLDLDAVVHAVASETAAALKAELAFVFLYDENTQSFRLAGSYGLPAESVQSLRVLPYKPAQDIFTPARSHTRNWLPLAMWSDAGSGQMPAFAGALTVPILHKQDLVGMISAVTTNSGHSFSPEECDLLGGLADQAALAIANARLFDQVRAGRERLQALSRRLVELQETERRAIARELHDEVGQALTGLSLVLGMAARTATSGAHDHLGEAQTIVTQLLKQVRDLSLDLRPAMLDDLGLVSALTWQVRRYISQTGIEVDVKVMGLEGKRFPPAVETAAYRVIQEALTNIARYARVKTARVRVWTEADCLGLLIEDEGIGFDAERIASINQSSGLIGMRERALLLGGQFVLESAPGEGTRIHAKLPLNGFVERRMEERGA